MASIISRNIEPLLCGQLDGKFNAPEKGELPRPSISLHSQRKYTTFEEFGTSGRTRALNLYY